MLHPIFVNCKFKEMVETSASGSRELSRSLGGISTYVRILKNPRTRRMCRKGFVCQ